LISRERDFPEDGVRWGLEQEAQTLEEMGDYAARLRRM
jgi:hypothetical protein